MHENDEFAYPSGGGAARLVRGMTLRDWFAGCTITGVLATEFDTETADWAACARLAYELADAMLAERNKSRSSDSNI